MGGANSSGRQWLRSFSVDLGLTREDIELLWGKYDKNKDGVLDANEALKFFVNYAEEHALDNPVEVAQELFKRFDGDKDGCITKQELTRPENVVLLSSLNLEAGINEAQFRKIWKQYDENHDGYLDKTEALAFLLAYAVSKKWGPNVELAEDLLSRLDTNGDGRLTYAELVSDQQLKLDIAERPVDDFSRFGATVVHPASLQMRTMKEEWNPAINHPASVRPRGLRWNKEVKAPAPDVRETFEVQLRRPMGIDIFDSKWGTFVRSFLPGSAVEQWNAVQAKHGKDVRPGDFIVKVGLESGPTSLVGLTHAQVFSLLGAATLGQFDLELERAGPEQRAFLDWYLNSNEPTSAGEIYTVKLTKPPGFSIAATPWGTCISSITGQGCVTDWNLKHTRKGKHICVGDFIVGSEETDHPAAITWTRPTAEPLSSEARTAQSLEHMEAVRAFLDGHPAEEPILTLRLQYRSQFQNEFLRDA